MKAGWLCGLMMATLATALWAEPPPRGRPGHEGCPAMFRRHLMNDLTPEQEARVRQIWYETRKKMIPLMAEKQQLRLDLEQMLEQKDINREQVLDLVDKIQSVKGRMARLKMEAFLRIREELGVNVHPFFRRGRGMKGRCPKGRGFPPPPFEREGRPEPPEREAR